jgi:hypothetical protein
MRVALCLSSVFTEATENFDDWLLLLGKYKNFESGDSSERGTGCIKYSNTLIDFIPLRSARFYLSLIK